MSTRSEPIGAYPRPASLPKRAATVVRTGGAHRLVGAACREAALASRGAALSAGLARAARRGDDVLVGPFVGEVGFELLYWIPFVRRALRRHGIAPERVTTLSRGGAGCWYGDLAAHHIDAFDLLGPQELAAGLAARRAAAGDHKLLTVEPFDRELTRRALAGRHAFVLHPSAMYTRLRPFWAGWRPQAGIDRLLAAEPLTVAGPRPEGLPGRYVAVRGYFGDCLPDTAESHAALAETVERLAAEIDVVVLTAGSAADGHREWAPAPGPRIHLLAPPDPAENLAVQSRVVAHAQGLVAPYGGFSYLGALLGVPTLALRSHATDNPVHRATLQRALPHARYDVAQPSPAAVSTFLQEVAR